MHDAVGPLTCTLEDILWFGPNDEETGGMDDATACCVLWTAREALGKSFRIGLNSPLGILALSDIRAGGDGAWTGSYLNFPRCQCLSQVKGDRVLSLAMPSEAQLSDQLRLA